MKLEMSDHIWLLFASAELELGQFKEAVPAGTLFVCGFWRQPLLLCVILPPPTLEMAYLLWSHPPAEAVYAGLSMQ